MDGLKGQRTHFTHQRGTNHPDGELDGKTKRAGKPGNTNGTSKALQDLEIVGTDTGLQSLERDRIALLMVLVCLPVCFAWKG